MVYKDSHRWCNLGNETQHISDKRQLMVQITCYSLKVACCKFVLAFHINWYMFLVPSLTCIRVSTEIYCNSIPVKPQPKVIFNISICVIFLLHCCLLEFPNLAWTILINVLVPCTKVCIQFYQKFVEYKLSSEFHFSPSENALTPKSNKAFQS